MRPVLIDTNAYSAFMRGDANMAEVFSRVEKLCVSSVVLGELLYGFRAGNREARNRQDLSRFLDSPRVAVLPVTPDTADCYSLIFTALYRKGKPIPTNDVWIAASALEHGVALLTLDAHFQAIEGLKVGTCIEDFLP